MLRACCLSYPVRVINLRMPVPLSGIGMDDDSSKQVFRVFNETFFHLKCTAIGLYILYIPFGSIATVVLLLSLSLSLSVPLYIDLLTQCLWVRPFLEPHDLLRSNHVYAT
jgi:hypothetical protein